MTNQTVSLIEQLQKLGARLSANENDQAAQNEALELSRKLTASLEQPRNVAVDLMYSPFLAIAATVADGMDLFKHIVNSNGPVTVKQLASLSNAEELLITRILRPLAAIGFVNEVGEQTWEATPLTEVMAEKEISAGFRMVDSISTAAGIKAPKYFREKGYKSPADPRNGLLQYAYNTSLPTFELLSTMPDAFAAFNTFMGSVTGGRRFWTDWYPVEERLLPPLPSDGHAEDSTLLVDVGGGKGHDILDFHAKYSGRLPGRLVLQDTEEVIRTLTDLDSGVETMAYDFFTEQPVKGARVYFYHHIFHDWPDELALEMLQQVKKAMKPGYSRLLIHDLIIPEQNADRFSGVFDLVLMAFSCGVERTGTQWRELLGKAGFGVVKVWHAPEPGADGLVEAMLEGKE